MNAQLHVLNSFMKVKRIRTVADTHSSGRLGRAPTRLPPNQGETELFDIRFSSTSLEVGSPVIRQAAFVGFNLSKVVSSYQYFYFLFF